MADPTDAPADDVEARTRAAHRSYMTAVLALEQFDQNIQPEQMAPAQVAAHRRLLSAADAHKEDCRRTLRDLLDRLGYVPDFQENFIDSRPTPSAPKKNRTSSRSAN